MSTQDNTKPNGMRELYRILTDDEYGFSQDMSQSHVESTARKVARKFQAMLAAAHQQGVMEGEARARQNLKTKLTKQAVKEARLDELDQLWLSSCDPGCKKCDFKQIMTCNGPDNKDITVVERRKDLRKQSATPHQKEEGGE